MGHYLTEPFRLQAICTAFDFYWDSSFQFFGESHQDWEMVFVLSGSVEVTEDERVYILGPGDLIFHSAQEFHSIRSTGGTRPHVRVVSFEHSGNLPSRLTEGVFSLSLEESEEHSRIFEQILQLKKEPQPDPWLLADVRFSFSALFLRIARKQPRQDRESRSRSAWEYYRAVKAMKEALYENLTLEALCVRTAISRSTMKQLFKTYAGIGPAAYYDRLRGLEALRLLEEGKPIRQIAEDLDYSSPNYFCTCFKKLFGETPGQWRASRTGK